MIRPALSVRDGLARLIAPPQPARAFVAVRSRIWWLALAALPIVLAACNNSSGGGNGY